MGKHVNKLVAVWALALTAFLVMGLTVPHTFTPGTIISSSEVNANFAAVNAAVTAMETRPGRTVAIARVDAAGSVTSSWMENGMTPTVAHTTAGIYDITFPGEPIAALATNRCVLASLMNFGAGSADAYATVDGLATGEARIRTFNFAGALTNAAFWILITAAP